LGGVLVACAPETTPLPTFTPEATPPASPTPTPPPVSPRAGGFAAYVRVPVEVEPAVPAYTPDLGLVANAELLGQLTPEQRATLEDQGVVIVPQGFGQIYDIYNRAEERGIPAFVTTDAVLHAYHVLYNYALRLAEKEHFIADLEALSAAMLDAARQDAARLDAAPSDVVEPAVRQTLAFFAVGHKLLVPDAEVPDAVQDVVAEELALIDAHSGYGASPIFGYPEDYSQYVPRGHYTRNADFERYFRAMMWYGRMGFHLKSPDDPEAARRETRAALLIVRYLYDVEVEGTPALDLWERIYEPTAFFVGTADDLTVYDYTAVAQQIYGAPPDLAALADEALLDAFIEAARQVRPPRIVGELVTDREDPEEVTQGFRFMGQRFIPDSYIFQQLVYDEVTLYQGQDEPFTLSMSQAGPIRGFPRGLDVPAVLGSERALALLEAAGDTDYQGYDAQMAKLRAEFAELPEDQWTENLYWNWLHALTPLLQVRGEGYPAFMQSSAWVDKDLHTWLGSWTELRHDTILYAKQSQTIEATGAMPEPDEAPEPPGYVEPRPRVYARLAALTAQMKAGLGGRGLLNEEMTEALDAMERLQLDLKAIAERELRGEPLDDADYDLIRGIGGTLEDLTTFSAEVEGAITSEADERMALIADVHTDVNSGLVLEEAIGNAFPIYVIVLVEGQQWVAMGGAFSYYEFKQPMSDRLTDEAWQALSPKPERPDWTQRFIVE
jgi:hypothetical protein